VSQKLLIISTYWTFSNRYMSVKTIKMANLNDVFMATFGLMGIIFYAIGILDFANILAFLVYMGLVFRITYWVQINGDLDNPGNSEAWTNPFFAILCILAFPLVYIPTFAAAIFVYMHYISPFFDT